MKNFYKLLPLLAIGMILCFASISNAQNQKVNNTFEGDWKADFTFESNTKKPNEKRHSWISFTMKLTKNNKLFDGKLLSTETNGVVKGKVVGNKFTGTMRLGWDKKDWNRLTFTLEKDGKTATGSAVSTVAVGETHTYSVRLTKISTSKPVEDNWKLFNGAGFSVVMPTNVEKKYVEFPTSGGIIPTNISSVVEENLLYQIMDGPNAYSRFFEPGESTLQANESLYRKYLINDMQAGLCQPYQQFGCQLVFSNRKVNKGMISRSKF